MFDLLKKSISSSPLGKVFTTAKNIVGAITPKKPISTPYQPAPNIQTPKGPAYVPPPVIKPTQPAAPIAPINQPSAPSTSLKTAPGQYPTPEVAQSMVDTKMTDKMNVAPRSTVPAASTSPDNTKSALQQARQTLEDQFLQSLKPSSTSKDLADLRLEGAKLTEQYNKEYKALQENPEGKLSGNLEAQLRQTKEKQNEQLGYLALRESALTGALQLDKDTQKSIIDNIKTISGMTQADLVGSLQQDDVTGEVSGFFRNPNTGEIEQKTVGQMTPSQDLTYEKVGGQLVAIDKRTGNVVKTYGGGGGDSVAFADEVDAYAQQYASTGTKPTALPEGVTFGMIMQRAADLPKGPGLVVDKNTNVKSSGVSAAIEGDITQLYTISNKVKELKELDKKRWGGVVSGTFGKLTGSEAQQKYVDLRDEIIDLLARNRTGAALTGKETSFYGDQIPGRFSEPFGLGSDSSVRLNNFENKINSSIRDYLNTNNLAIYGLSEVEVGGKTMKVGDIIDINGIKGRVNPNGTITPQGDFSSAGNASASNIPQRNNNPGNIKQGGMADKYATGVDQYGHLIFPDTNTGFQAMQEDIQAKVSGQSQWLPANPTIAQLGKVYAEDPNWSTSVSRILGVSPSTPTQSVSLAALTKAIAQQEGFYA